MSRSAPKAAQYVLALDGARCEGDWDAVPEFVRKVRKHTPNRACLTLTASTEVAIEKATRTTPAARADASAPAKGLDVAGLLPELELAINNETQFLPDRFQARVCMGWLHWVAGDYDNALNTLPGSLNDELTATDDNADGAVTTTATDWTRVCALKSAYLRANCLARKARRKEALAVFQSELPCITLSSTAQQHWQQLRYWSELFLTEYCMLQSHTLEQGETTLEDPNCLVSLRAWAKYWGGSAGSAQLGGSGFRGSVPRRRIWFEYYSVLSSLLEDDLPVPAPNSEVAADGSAEQTSTRSQLRVELKKVEAIYETLLLEETSFPRAEDEREEVEAFVRLVMQNWSVLKGRGWRDSDLGQGGKESASRGVLDILYRASTKTYHSTAILRNLFTVHLAVAEFELAFKAFDSYFGLVKKAKARVIKTGKDEPSLDEDEIVLETVSLCIVALCRYSDRKGAEKAYHLGQELEECLLELSHGAIPEQDDDDDENGNPAAKAPPKTTLVAKTKGTDVPLRIVALAWQAVGLSLAQWSRMSFDSASRTAIQAKAVRCLRKSLSQEYGRTANLRGVFSLGLLLAEQRELGAAIELVKGALLSGKTPDADQDFLNGPFWRERAMIPLWHLLSLLLSARQDYVMAARACEGAFEQFKDPSTLFGSEHIYRSEHLNEAEAMDEKNGWTLGLVDEMEDFEKERILEVKMTQLALVELLESPKVAVNASLELLSLYARLFGPPQSGNAKNGNLLQAPQTSVPKSSAGTLRSIKGSIFGRSGRPATKAGGATGASEKPPSTSASRPQTQQTVTSSRGDGSAPTIQVTKDYEEFRRTRKSSGPTYERRSQSGKRNSLRKRDSSGSRRRAVSSGGAHVPTVVDGDAFFTPFDEANAGNGDFFSTSSATSASLPTGSSRRRLSGGVAAPPISLSRQASQVDSLTAAAATSRTGASSSLSTSSTATGAITDLAPEGVETSLSLMPLIQFSEEHEKRRRNTILIEVWLMIAGFYRRAEMFDDAKRSAAEAQKLVQELEMEVARTTSGGGAANRNRTWVGKKTVDELWGDVWSEMGYLSLDKGNAHTARLEFETALTHFADHPAATIGLSNILLDIYSEKLVLPHAIPRLELADGSMFPPSKAASNGNKEIVAALPSRPLGLASSPSTDVSGSVKLKTQTSSPSLSTPVIDRDFANLNLNSINAPAPPAPKSDAEQLPPPYKATSLPLIDRLASRDRASALLTGLTKLGSSWNNAEAWFALARAHEESGQPEKAKEVLWWCVELEESAGVRPWSSVATGGYIL